MEENRGDTLTLQRTAVRAATEALAGLGDRLWEAGELGPMMAELDDLVRMATAAQAVVLAEAISRGEPGQVASGLRGSSARAWVQEHAPHLCRTGGASRLVSVVRELTSGQGERLRPERTPLWDMVSRGEATVGSAAVVIAELGRLEHRVAAETVPGLWSAYAEVAAAGATARQARGLRESMLGRFGAPDELQRDADAAARFVRLSAGVQDGALWRYDLVVDGEGRAVLEAALGPASAPRPLDGDPDLRSSDQRRGQALVDLLRRSVAFGAAAGTQAKTALLVTLDVRDLRGRMQRGTSPASVNGPPDHERTDHDLADQIPRVTPGAGRVLGTVATGVLIPPESLRRLACDAVVVPTVLGSDGEVLDVGRERRLFGTAQLRQLWRRDDGCTMPGCTVPAMWTDAHHLWHWADGGPTDLGNAALLCGRHHTVVHTRDLHGRVEDGRVRWDTTPGTYTAWLTTGRRDCG